MQNFHWDLAEISKISPRLQRSCRDLVPPWHLYVSESRRDCSEISYISLRLVTSHQDCRDLAKIAEILPQILQRSRHDVCGFLKSWWDRGGIFYLSPRSRRDVQVFPNRRKISPRSCWDFERHKHLTKIAYISPRSRQDLERTRILPRSCQNRKHLAEGTFTWHSFWVQHS